MKYEIIITSQALKDMKRIKLAGLQNKVENLLDAIIINPFQTPPTYEKLSGHNNRYSRRINSKHRLIYEIDENTIKIIRMWTHYE